MRRILKIGIVALALSALLYVGWTVAETFYFYNGPSENMLSETGFDQDAVSRGELAHTYRYAPAYGFWSDGAEKHRYIFIPPGMRIDNSDPNRWNFPQGTRIWKVFHRDGVYVETRMLFKTGPEAWQWDMAVYQPRADGADSEKLAWGRSNVAGTPHDIPSPSACISCHSSGDMRRPLGITAIQLPWEHNTDLSITRLVELDLLTDPPSSPYTIPGNSLTQSALGYFDTNCGTCHYEGSTYVPEEVPLRLNLTTDTLASVEATNAYLTTIEMPPYLPGFGTEVYIRPGSPTDSFIYRRMSVRDGGFWQMPPLATETAHIEGMAIVEQWITSLSNREASETNGPE